MVVHDGAVPETVLGIGTSTVIMAFVSQFLKNEIAQLQGVEGRMEQDLRRVVHLQKIEKLRRRLGGGGQ